MRKSLMLALLLAGCQLAPPHSRPDLPTAPAYPAQRPADAAPGAAATAIAWQDFYADPRLRALIEAGLQRNRDLAVATARIAEARGLYRIQQSERLPGLSTTAGAARSRAIGSSGSPEVNTRYAVTVSVPAFELDFWGRVRALSDAARAQYLATEEGERAFRIILIRNIAVSYFALLEAEERIALAVATVASREEGLRIADLRLKAGVTSALDTRQAESLLTQAEAELAGLRLARAQAENLLTILAGGPLPQALPDSLPLAAEKASMAVAAGLPSDLLLARPDVLAAEQQLRAARANIGAARAAFFPRIAITGNLGYASTDLGGLFGADGLSWSFGPAVSLPIFDWGARRGNLEAARARGDIAVASYESAVQQAFREVADALAGRRWLAEQVAAQGRAVDAQRQIARLAQIRYREGVAGYLEVLDAERNLFTAEQALIGLRRAELQNLASLYAALGGGNGAAVTDQSERASAPQGPL